MSGRLTRRQVPPSLLPDALPAAPPSLDVPLRDAGQVFGRGHPVREVWRQQRDERVEFPTVVRADPLELLLRHLGVPGLLLGGPRDLRSSGPDPDQSPRERTGS